MIDGSGAEIDGSAVVIDGNAAQIRYGARTSLRMQGIPRRLRDAG